MSKTREQINAWLKNIDVDKKTVLDVGAGRPRAWLFGHFEGKPTRVVKGKPEKYKTCDYNEEFGCDFHIDLNKLYSAEWFAMKGKFDYVFCMETLEHLWNVHNALDTLSRLTKEELFISVPFVYVIHDVYDYARYTSQFFQKVLPRYGFKKIDITPITVTDKGVYSAFLKSEGIRMSKVSRKLGFSENFWDLGYCVRASKLDE